MRENRPSSRRFGRFSARFSSLEQADRVRRFVKLLDLLYDRRVRLVIACETCLEELFKDIRQEVQGPRALKELFHGSFRTRTS